MASRVATARLAKRAHQSLLSCGAEKHTLLQSVDDAKRLRLTPAMPSRPVPSRAKLEGSGVTADTSVIVKTPPSLAP